MTVVDARTVALGVLAGVDRGGRSDRLLDEALRGSGLDARDRRLATEIVYGTLRRQRQLDRTLERFVKRRWSDLDPEVRAALRLGAYQATCLDSVPVHAAIDTAVEALKRSRPRAAPLANAVLRTWQRQGGRLLDPANDEAERWQVPRWWLDRMRARHGDAAADWLQATAEPPVIALRVPPATGDPAALAEELRGEGVETVPSPWCDRALRVVSGPFLEAAAVREGRVQLRSEAAQLVTALLSDSGETLDVCAGRGGKSRQLAERPGQGAVVAVDVDPGRLRHALPASGAPPLGRPLRRLAADASRPLPLSRRFPAVLVDAPCSGLGTVRRHPEIKWRITPRRLRALADLQGRILASALESLAPGGELLWVTCSTEPEENEEVVGAVVAATAGVERRPVRAPGPAAALVDAEGWFRTAPTAPDLDGFVAARLVRAPDS